MAKFVVGVIGGSLVTLLAMTIFVGLLSVPAERDLIDNWREIYPGMPYAEVERILGSPSYDMRRPGTGFPEWTEKSVPDDYYVNHRLVVFTIRPMGQRLLLVLDYNDRVTFVSSIPP